MMMENLAQNLARARAMVSDVVESAPAMPDAPVARPPSRAFPAATSVMLRTYAVVPQKPRMLQFDRHLLRFSGFNADERNAALIWGVYGTESMGRANVYAALDARRAGQKLFQIDLWYRVQRRPLGGTQVLTAEVIRQNGFLQFQRLDSDYREHLRSLFIERLQETEDFEIDALRLESSLEALVAARPMLVHWLMSSCTWLHAVQHTVFIGSSASLRIVTVRREPDRYLHVETRYNEDIKTSVQSAQSVMSKGGE